MCLCCDVIDRCSKINDLSQLTLNNYSPLLPAPLCLLEMPPVRVLSSELGAAVIAPVPAHLEMHAPHVPDIIAGVSE